MCLFIGARQQGVPCDVGVFIFRHACREKADDFPGLLFCKV